MRDRSSPDVGHEERVHFQTKGSLCCGTGATRKHRVVALLAPLDAMHDVTWNLAGA